MNEDEDHRYLMFSATFNKECRKLAREYLSTDHIRISVGRAGASHIQVSQVVCNFSTISPFFRTLTDHADSLCG